MDGIPDFWDLDVVVLHSSNHIPARRNLLRDWDDVELFNVDHVITNAEPSHFEAMLYIFEDNEAVIKIIIWRLIGCLT